MQADVTRYFFFLVILDQYPLPVLDQDTPKSQIKALLILFFFSLGFKFKGAVRSF